MTKNLIGLTIFLGCIAINGCKQATVSAESSARPKHYIVLLDLSSSRSQATREEGAQFISRLSQTLHFGDHVTLLQMQEVGLTDHPQHWSDDMPAPADASFVTSHDRKMLEAEQENVQNAVTSLSSVPEGVKLLHTDIFTTLGLAGQDTHDYDGWPTDVIVLSDMLQSAKGIEMDRAKRMPPANWVAQQKHVGLLPNLSGACVLIIGADGVTPSGLKVRDFWLNYFAATGAKLPVANYRSRPPLTGQVACSPA